MMGYGWRFGDAAGLWWLLAIGACVVLIVGVVLLIALIARGGRHPSPPGQTWTPSAPVVLPSAAPRPSPHDILRERLARGEITIEEFERTKAALGPDAAPPGNGTAGSVPPQGPVPPPSF